jgi:hypothetical protein
MNPALPGIELPNDYVLYVESLPSGDVDVRLMWRQKNPKNHCPIGPTTELAHFTIPQNRRNLISDFLQH